MGRWPFFFLIMKRKFHFKDGTEHLQRTDKNKTRMRKLLIEQIMHRHKTGEIRFDEAHKQICVLFDVSHRAFLDWVQFNYQPSPEEGVWYDHHNEEEPNKEYNSLTLYKMYFSSLHGG